MYNNIDIRKIYLTILLIVRSDSMTINYAHRGASGYYPENTMLAFEKAIELGCSGIETDVQLTKDGHLVLIHDEKLDRTTNAIGYVKDYTYNEIRNLDAGSFKDKCFKDATIPTAEELIELAIEENILINFELKTGEIWYEGIEEKLINLIYKYNIKDRVIISSFNHYSISMCKQLDKNIKAGLLYSDGLYEPQLYAKIVGAEALHPYFLAVDNAALIDRIKSSGIMINAYTINEKADMKRFLDYKVDGIITNYPDKLNKLMKE